MNINLTTWFSERELDYCPKHFVQVTTPIDDDKHLWILDNLKGRFTVAYKQRKDTDEFLFLFEDMYPCFEDPQEAVLYELKFS